MERACGYVLLVEIQQVSEVLLQNFWKLNARCHDNIFALLEWVSLFKVPYRAPQEMTHFLRVMAAEYNISTYHLLTLAHL